MQMGMKGIVSAAASIVVLGWVGASHAGYTISTCQVTCESDCTDPGSGPNCHEAVGGECVLVGDLNCSSTTDPAIRLRDGMDLDFNGHTVTCAANVDCADAVLMQSTNSKIYNNDPGEAVITGGFMDGVDCALNSGSDVTGIKIVDTYIGIHDCKTIKQNVITGLGRTIWTGNFGILTNGVSASGDTIENNYIADKTWDVWVAGNDAVEVSSNVFHTTTWSNCGVYLENSASTAKVLNNTVMGVGNAGFGSTRKVICTAATPPSGADIAGNLCDEDHPDCASCIAAAYCEPFVAPFLP